MRLDCAAFRALRAAISKKPHTIAAKATDIIAMLRGLSRFGEGRDVAVSTAGGVAAGLLTLSAGGADGGSDWFAAVGVTGTAAGFDSGWLLAATSVGGAAAATGGVAAGCGVSATTGGVVGVGGG